MTECSTVKRRLGRKKPASARRPRSKSVSFSGTEYFSECAWRVIWHIITSLPINSATTSAGGACQPGDCFGGTAERRLRPLRAFPCGVLLGRVDRATASTFHILIPLPTPAASNSSPSIPPPALAFPPEIPKNPYRHSWPFPRPASAPSRDQRPRTASFVPRVGRSARHRTRGARRLRYRARRGATHLRSAQHRRAAKIPENGGRLKVLKYPHGWEGVTRPNAW
jgi:hypothetical protein